MLDAAAMLNAKLTIELVPSTCWYSNVRTNVSATDWELCKRFVRARSGDCCEVCGQTGIQQGWNWTVECHEVWDFDDETSTQRLEGLIALCPLCHRVKHIGRVSVAESPEMMLRVVEHLMSVNGFEPEESELFVHQAFTTWALRSEHDWTLDISYLTEVLGP